MPDHGLVCGRYASFREAQDLADAFAIDATLVEPAVRELAPSWNVAPTQDVRIVVERVPRRDSTEPGDAPQRSLRLARWGLVPSWAKDPSVGNRMINARVESLADKPAFAKPFASRRCIVPADGYYEWKKLEPAPGSNPSGRARVPKQPYYIAPADDDVAALAGLYEFWRDPSRAVDDPRRWLVSTTIVTMPASEDLASIHDRMPLVLPRSAWDAWLDPSVGAEGAAALLSRAPEPLRFREVSSLVSNVNNNSPALLAPVD